MLKMKHFEDLGGLRFIRKRKGIKSSDKRMRSIQKCILG